MANISRVDSGKTHGWLVRFQRGDDKRGKLFSDRKHGGADDALAAAQAWRDEQRRELGPEPASTAAHLQTPDMRRRNRRSVNTSGVTGIGVTHRTFGQSTVPYMTAYWIDEGGDGVSPRSRRLGTA